MSSRYTPHTSMADERKRQVESAWAAGSAANATTPGSFANYSADYDANHDIRTVNAEIDDMASQRRARTQSPIQQMRTSMTRSLPSNRRITQGPRYPFKTRTEQATPGGDWYAGHDLPQEYSNLDPAAASQQHGQAVGRPQLPLAEVEN